MISAQNLLLRSNGNRIAYFSIFILLLWIGCNPTKKIVAEKQDQIEDAERPKVYNPNTGQYEYADKENTRVDTIEWMDDVDPEIPIIY